MGPKTGKALTVFALILFVVSVVGSWQVQTNDGEVEISDVRWETPAGYMLSALLLRPKNATAETPAPAIVTAHGILNSREMQHPNYIELAKRGYVVLAIDMYAHGFSQIVTGPQRDGTRGTGMYDAVELVATLPFVDKDKIGATGHSFGGRSANWSIPYDDKKDKPLIAAVFLQAADATYADKDGKYYNYYGARDVGMLAVDFDEFFFRQKQADGSMSKPREFIDNSNAQSFLHFGAAPGDFGDKRVIDTMYTQEIDGKEYRRVIYRLPVTHPRIPYIREGVAGLLEFFDASLGAPVTIDNARQTWEEKEIYAGIGCVAYVLFIIGLTRVLLGSSAFSCLAGEAPAIQPLADATAGKWVWRGLFLSFLVSAVSYVFLFEPVNNLQPGFRTQYAPLFIGIWSAVNGAFTIILLSFYYGWNAKRTGLDLEETGVAISLGKLILTIILALTVVFTAHLLVFLAHYLFRVDFRFWLIAIKSFNADKLPFVLKTAPLFLVYYIANSVAINCFNRFKMLGTGVVNVIVLGFFNALSGLVILAWQYGTFFKTGETVRLIQALQGIHLITIVLILFVSALVSRIIYRMSRNPYLGGIINGLAVTLITLANTQTLYY